MGGRLGLPSRRPDIVTLEPLPYHLRLRDYLKSQHEELYQWFRSADAQSDYRESVQMHLLKTTYRMERGAHESHYRLVDEAAEALGLPYPVTLYQAQSAGGEQASLYFTPGHGHVVFAGRILELLDDSELLALIGHELAHFKLWTADDGAFLTIDHMIATMANEPRAAISHEESARLWQLFTEIYADRGSAVVSGDPNAAASMLLKVCTGLAEVDPESYRRQADDVFSREDVSTEGWTHPELFIRVRALALWEEQGETMEAEVARMIQGKCYLERLDLLEQKELQKGTRQFLRYHLRHSWLRTEKVLAHAGMFFPSGLDEPGPDLNGFKNRWLSGHEKIRDYFCFLLLDFAVVDPELDQNALAVSFLTAEELDLGDRFEELARKELKLLKRDTTKIREGAAKMVEQAASEEGGGSDE